MSHQTRNSSQKTSEIPPSYADNEVVQAARRHVSRDTMMTSSRTKDEMMTSLDVVFLSCLLQALPQQMELLKRGTGSIHKIVGLTMVHGNRQNL